jgi:hypothetical protein
MTRLVAASGLLFIEAAAHAYCAGTWAAPSLWSTVVPALLATSPAICRTADAWFRAMTECG